MRARAPSTAPTRMGVVPPMPPLEEEAEVEAEAEAEVGDDVVKETAAVGETGAAGGTLATCPTTRGAHRANRNSNTDIVESTRPD